MDRNDLPKPRVLVNNFFTQCDPNNDGILNSSSNIGGLMFAQFITHDVSDRQLPQAKDGGPGISCCLSDGSAPLPSNRSHSSCAPIIIPADDPTLQPRKCMNFIRTQSNIDSQCILSPKTQTNGATSYLDLSVIYGDTDVEANSLRSYSNGKLKMSSNGLFASDLSGNYILPDERATQTPVLAAIHIVFMREHNRICDEILKLQPSWDDERVYQEARRWNIAQYQSIIVKEWLPFMLGEL